jgi:hypothetical protein
VPITVEGTTTITYSATDRAGNKEPSKTLTFRIDKTPPTTYPLRSPLPDASGVNDGPLTVTLKALDLGGSGSKAITYTLEGAQTGGATIAGDHATLPISASGPTTITYAATDRAGNRETPTTLDVTVDTGIPSAVLNPVTLAFGSVRTGSSSAVQTVTLTSNGGAPLVLNGVSLAGTNPGDFTVQATTCGPFPATLPPTATCTATVGFGPTAAGVRSGTVVFADNASTSPQTVVLSGTGNAPPTLSLPGGQTVQYSDALSFQIHAAGPESSDVLTVSAAGLPAGLSFADNGSGNGTVSGTVQAAAGSYTVTFAVSDGYSAAVTGSLKIAVTREGAAVATAASNPTAVKVNTAGGTAGPVTLHAAITEATDDTTNGNISNAVPVTYTLTPVGPGSSYTCTATSSGGGVGGTLATSCTFPALAVNLYDVRVGVGGSYYHGSDDSVLAVYDPSLGFVTGGGTVIHNGVRANFGFNAKYLKSGQIQGSVLCIEHRASGNVVVKSNSMGSLSIAGNTAYIIGKATLGGVGNYSFQVTAVDNGEPGVSDQFGFHIKDPTGVAVPDLTYAPITLSGGNVVVPHR